MRDEFEEEKQTTRRQTRGTLARRFHHFYHAFTVAHLKILNGSQVNGPVFSQPMLSLIHI